MSRLRPTAFLDRDGVLNVDTGYPHRPEDLLLTPSAAAAVRRLNHAGALTIVATNQSGVARGMFDLHAVDRFHAIMQAQLATGGAFIDAFYVAPFHPDGIVPPYNIEHEDRKPGAGMLLRALAEWPVDPRRAVLFGDKPSDMAAARNAGIEGILVESDICDLDVAVADWLARIDVPSLAGRSQ